MAKMKSGLGLRERKKLDAMRRIQTTAIALFEEHGFDAVTIERVAAEADVSPSSVYRYFGTKEQLVLYDEYDPLMLEALDRVEPGTTPLAALRTLLRGTISDMAQGDEERIRRRIRFVYTVPSVNAAMAQDAAETEDILRTAFARLTGRNADDFELQVFVSSVVAAFLTALRYWADHEGELTLLEGVERAMDVIEHDLEPPHSQPH